MAAEEVAGMRPEQDDIHGVVGAMPVVLEDSLLAMGVQGGEAGGNSSNRIEPDNQARKVSGENAEQGEQEGKNCCLENLYQPAEESLRMAGQLLNSDDLSEIDQVEVKVWTPSR